MPKANKIMMMTVSVLLCLVLLTTSAISGTLAKYTTTAESSASARVAKWGAKIDITLSEDVKGKLESADYSNLSVIQFKQDEALGMGAGKSYPEALKIKFSGTSEVRLKVKLVIGIKYEDGLKKDNTHYVPMGIKMKGNNGSVENLSDDFIGGPWFSGTSADELVNNAQTNINNGIAGKLDFTPDKPNNSTCVEKIFAPNEQILFNVKDDKTNTTVNELVFGLEWPNTHNDGTGKNYNAIGQHLLEQCADGKFGLNFTIIIEQVR
jgi:hypothetical protein